MIKYLHVEAHVRYWEDAKVNNLEDTEGTLIPLRCGNAWCPVIDLDAGKIVDWPQGTTASIHYKVCDAGHYWLSDSPHKRTYKYKGDYVPDRFLCHGDRGFGDYIIMRVNDDGKIQSYSKPSIDEDQWEGLFNG